MAFVSCTKLDTELAKKQGKLKKCDGTDLPDGTNVPTCAEVDTAVAAKQGQLRNCAGANIAANDQVPLCSEMTAAIAAGVTGKVAAGTNTTLAGTGTSADPYKVSVDTATDTIKGISALNNGTSLPGDATNCTDALTACGLNALLADATVGGNAVINGVKALQRQISSVAQAQAWTDNTTDLTPLRLDDAFKGANQSKSGGGYQRLPGGIILQWGYAASSPSGLVTNFPLTFPNACFRILISTLANVAPYDVTRTTHLLSFDNSSFTAICGRINGGDGYYLAIGH